jgi:UDP-glucose 4-epimerase
MKVLITGGRGFIGSHLANRLRKDGHEVVAFDNLSHPSRTKLHRDIKFRYGDVRNKVETEMFVRWCDVVFHLAAQIHVDKSISNPQETIDVNITGTMNVLEAVRKHNKEMVFASTSEVYGTSQTGAMSEEHPLDAQSPYGASKIAADRLCKAYFETYKTKVKILRNFNTFGPGQADGGAGSSYGAVIGIFTRLALESKPMPIFGSGEQARDYMYIDDAVNAYLLVYEKGNYGETYNAGTGVPITVNNLVEFLEHNILPNSGHINVVARAGEVNLLCADAKKLRALGWEPERVTFENKLLRFINSYRKTRHA